MAPWKGDACSSETSEQGVDRWTSKTVRAMDTAAEEKRGKGFLSEFLGTVKKQEESCPSTDSGDESESLRHWLWTRPTANVTDTDWRTDKNSEQLQSC